MTFGYPVGYTYGDRIVALFACSYEFGSARYVLFGVLKIEMANRA